MSRISVLMPVRNGAASAPLAVRSTLRAMGDDDELVIHDDASTDATVELLTGIRDPRVRIIRAEEPLGVAGGLNRALEASTGDLIARMDADDVTLPWRFALQRQALDRGADMVFTGHIRFGTSVRDFKQKRPGAISAAGVRAWLALENPLLHPTLLSRASTVREVGGYRPGAAEDYDLWLRTQHAGARIVRLLIPAVAYRMHQGQVTASAGYLRRVAGDVGLAESHAALVADLGWTGEPVWDLLHTRGTPEAQQDTKERYWAFLRETAARLPIPFERKALSATLERAWRGLEAPAVAPSLITAG